MKTSIAPPDRHVFWTVTAPSSLISCSPSAASPAVGRMRRSSGSPLFIAFVAYSRTLCSAQTPPAKPSIVPSLSTSATFPARALVGR